MAIVGNSGKVNLNAAASGDNVRVGGDEGATNYSLQIDETDDSTLIVTAES